MSKLLPFPTRRVQQFAESVLVLSASSELRNKPTLWIDRPVPRESLGNKHQHLAIRQTTVVLILQSNVADNNAQHDAIERSQS
jgi:hypothetical protein